MSVINTTPSRVANKKAGGALTGLAVGLVLIVLGMWFSAGAQLSTGMALLVIAVAGGFAAYGLNRYVTPDPVDEHDAAEMSPGQLAMMGGEMGQLGGNPEVRRICEVAFNFSDTLTPVAQHFSFDDGKLDGFGFVSNKTGFFASEGNKTRLYEILSGAMGGGGWGIDFDAANDTVIASRKSSVPKLALPPVWPVVPDAAAALTAYNDWELTLGPGEDGMVTINPQVFPHCSAIATSGGGKSVFLRACIEQFRAVGGMVLLGDGKGSDYASLVDMPGVITVGRGSGTKGVEYIGAIEIAFRLMQQRQNTAAERKRRDPAGWKNVPPVFLVLDELKSVMKKWKTELDGKSFKSIESKVNQLLALGRELRIHVYTATQDVYAESIPPSWLTNIGLKISLGKPHHLTISKAFDESIRGQATRVAAGIDPKVRGRGMVAGVDEDSGQAQVVPYQGFLGYSPGEAVPGFFSGEQKAQWAMFKNQVSDNIPRLYSRKWFKIDSMSEAQEKKENETGVDLGYIDFEMFSMDEIANMQVVNLDMRDANGNIVPNPEMVKYDPNPDNAHYVCRPVLTSSNSIEEI